MTLSVSCFLLYFSFRFLCQVSFFWGRSAIQTSWRPCICRCPFFRAWRHFPELLYGTAFDFFFPFLLLNGLSQDFFRIIFSLPSIKCLLYVTFVVIYYNKGTILIPCISFSIKVEPTLVELQGVRLFQLVMTMMLRSMSMVSSSLLTSWFHMTFRYLEKITAALSWGDF